MADKENKKAPEAAEQSGKEVKNKFLNPFSEGVNYTQFLEAVKESKKDVAEYCKGHLTVEQLEWLEKDLATFKK